MDVLMRTRVARFVALLAAVTLLASCGGDDPTPPPGAGAGEVSTPEAYAHGICTAATAWMTALQGRNTQLQGDLDTTGEEDVQAVKALVVAFLDGAVQDTQQLIDEVSALDPPGVSGGGTLHQSLLSAFTQARDLFAGTRDQVDGLDPSDRAAFTEALSTMGTTLSDAGTEIAGSVQRVQNADLQAAFATSPACTALGSA